MYMYVGVLCCFALLVCLFDLLPSFSSLIKTCVCCMLLNTYVICCRIKQTWYPSDVDKERQREIENDRNGKVCIVITVYIHVLV